MRFDGVVEGADVTPLVNGAEVWVGFRYLVDAV
jgi:hypothetical protein